MRIQLDKLNGSSTKRLALSVVSLPHELQPWIYKYGVVMPFYNLSKIVRTVGGSPPEGVRPKLTLEFRSSLTPRTRSP